MKRHAYLIIAHKNFEQLKKLLVLLDDAQNDIFILIDKKSVFDKNDFLQICEKSNVQFVKRIHVNWGDTLR